MNGNDVRLIVVGARQPGETRLGKHCAALLLRHLLDYHGEPHTTRRGRFHEPALVVGVARFTWCRVSEVRLHSAADASRPAALLVGQILPVFSLLAPCGTGASAPSVRQRSSETRHKEEPRALASVRTRGSIISSAPGSMRNNQLRSIRGVACTSCTYEQEIRCGIPRRTIDRRWTALGTVRRRTADRR